MLLHIDVNNSPTNSAPPSDSLIMLKPFTSRPIGLKPVTATRVTRKVVSIQEICIPYPHLNKWINL